MPGGATRRARDVLVARRLGGARSSVFPPSREMLDAGCFPQVLCGGAAAHRSVDQPADLPQRPSESVSGMPSTGHGTSSRCTRSWAVRTLAPGVRLTSRRTARGAGQRIAALARWLDVTEARADLLDGAGFDDVLDALAAPGQQHTRRARRRVGRPRTPDGRGDLRICAEAAYSAPVGHIRATRGREVRDSRARSARLAGAKCATRGLGRAAGGDVRFGCTLLVRCGAGGTEGVAGR